MLKRWLSSEEGTAGAEPLPRTFLEWQVALRRHTMDELAGAPTAGVAPVLTVRRPGTGLGVVSHSIICGLLPRAEQLEAKTADFRELYESSIAEGAKHTYDRGIEYLRGYYRDADDFDAESITTLLAGDSPIVEALRAEPTCALLFYVFNLSSREELERFRCWQLDCRAELHDRGPVYENVWWHNALFHGKVEDSVVVRFRHRKSWDTGFGRFERLA